MSIIHVPLFCITLSRWSAVAVVSQYLAVVAKWSLSEYVYYAYSVVIPFVID